MCEIFRICWPNRFLFVLARLAGGIPTHRRGFTDAPRRKYRYTANSRVTKTEQTSHTRRAITDYDYRYFALSFFRVTKKIGFYINTVYVVYSIYREEFFLINISSFCVCAD